MDKPPLQSDEHLYDELIDAATWAFINETAKYYPDDTVNASIEQQRETYNTLCRAFHHGYPTDIVANNGTIDTAERSIPYRWYQHSNDKSSTTVVYYHGGGFVVGGLESHDDICAEICSETGFDVVSVDYRLSPEHVFPACFEDALAGFEHVANQSGTQIVLVGDSAGGNLAAAVCEATKNDEVKPVGQVLIYPGLGEKTDFGSYIRHQNAPMLTKKDVDFYHHIRTGGANYSGNPLLTPLSSLDFSNIPPTLVFSAQIDPLCDDGDLYVQRLQTAGVRAKWFCETGLVHGYLRARKSVERARVSFTRIIQAIDMIGNQNFISGD